MSGIKEFTAKSVVQAIQYDGGNAYECLNFCPDAHDTGDILVLQCGVINTDILNGDWIIKDGSVFLVMDPDEFSNTYKEVV